MNKKALPTILIIVGITGSLSRQRLLPAIHKIVTAEAAPDKFRIVGISRQQTTIGDILKNSDHAAGADFFSKHSDILQVDMTKEEDYQKLKSHLEDIEAGFGEPAQRLFYLSVPPQVSGSIIELLGKSGTAGPETSKLLLEKPFGIDLLSARELISRTMKHFKEEQIYRIDHYLAKEMAQNLIVFRDGNSLFKRTWNRHFIDSIEIMASEKIGIAGRAAFYEQTGALRDLVQSHLLQLAALTLMEIPEDGDLHKVPARRLKALRQLHLPSRSAAPPFRRGQYKGYRQEVGDPSSMVETYVELGLLSKDPNWAGVPIRIITGKALREKLTQIRLVYKKEREHESNELVIKLQPNEGIKIALWTKVPGYERRLEKHSLRLAFHDHFQSLPEAYEQVFLDAINSNHTLFTSSGEVLESWRILQPVQKAWAASHSDLFIYPPGSDGKELTVKA